MKYNRVLICIPPFMNEKPVTPFTGVGYISEILSSNNIEVEVFDMNLGYSEKILFKKIEKFNPDLIGFFLMTKFYKLNYKLIDKVKARFNITYIAGGPHLSTFGKNFLANQKLN